MKYLFILAFLSFFVIGDDQNYLIYKHANGKEIPVYISKPNIVDNKTRLVVVMHGRKRNGEEYRNQWKEYSEELNLFIVVPEFSEQSFPGVFGFNYGNIIDAEGNEIPTEDQLFEYILPLTKQIQKTYNLNDRWGIYGHGAGAHFVHRMVLHRPEIPYTLAIAANLGWYLTPENIDWPFGLINSGISDEMLSKAYSNYFLLMLGKSDLSTAPNTPYVASIFDSVSAQGIHRLERGRNFFKDTIEKAKELDVFLKWGMVEVPTKDGHSNTQQMVPYAAELFYERLR